MIVRVQLQLRVCPVRDVGDHLIHVHVEGSGGAAVFYWNGNEFELKSNKGVKPNDLKRVAKVIDDNKDIIIKLWNLYFGKESYE